MRSIGNLPSSYTILFCIAIFSAGILWNAAFSSPASLLESSNGLLGTPVRQTGKYQLIAPLLLCADNRNFSEDSVLRSSIQQAVATAHKDPNVGDISVYIRDDDGRWTGVNESESYDPGSLLKVPIMIAYYKQAESDPSLLTKRITYDGSFDYNQAEVFRSLNDIKPGVYKVDELIKAMIVNSDNNAEALLFNDIDQHLLSEVFTDLGLTVPPNSNGANPNYISAKLYSYFFRVLYNATYLNDEYSEKAMQLLSGNGFPQGIRSTVPANIVVAQKFGERSVVLPNGEVVQRELHNCGYVFIPGKPYLICIMTKGKDFKSLLSAIQSISALVYKEETTR